VLNPSRIWPEHLKGLPEARFNPMSVLDTKSPSFHAMCEKIAAVLIVEEEHSEGRHWTAAARLLVLLCYKLLDGHGDSATSGIVKLG
jgi:hypothetical protein